MTNKNKQIVFPRPRELNRENDSVTLKKNVAITANNIPQGCLLATEQLLAENGISINGKSDFSITLEIDEACGQNISPQKREEYYELDLSRNAAFIRSPAKQGILWGAQSLIDLYRAADKGHSLPSLKIRDWPELPNRGILVENKWGPDRMTLDDWKLVINRMASLKMNRIGIGLYGCWGDCRFEHGENGLGNPAEFLMVPVPDYPQLKSLKRLRWYSPENAKWHDETYLPYIFEKDFLGAIVDYGHKRGVTVIPFVNSLGHNSLIPGLIPEIAAIDKNGNPSPIGYCLSNPETRKFIESFYSGIVKRYFGGKAEFFHIQMDEVRAEHHNPESPETKAEPWCHCPECAKSKPEELMQEYVIWLTEMLTRNGVDKVIIWNDQFTRHMDALDNRFVEKLKERGLDKRLILHWWWYGNNELNDQTRVSIGKKLGIPGWVAPMTCYYNWDRYNVSMKNIELMLAMAHDEGAEGAVAYAVHDPGWTDHEMLLSGLAWNPSSGNREKELESWAQESLGKKAAEFLSALASLQQAANNQAFKTTCYYSYTYIRPGKPFPREYPGEALTRLNETENAVDNLRETAQTARIAETIFAKLSENEQGIDSAMTKSLRAEAARIKVLSDIFAELLPIWQETRGNWLSVENHSLAQELADKLIRNMAVIESNKPRWIIPSTLQGLSVLLDFLQQLAKG